MLLLARYWPSALIAIAHISPGLFWSAIYVSTRPSHFHDDVAMAKKAQGVPTDNLSVLSPYTLFALAPYLDFAFEASTRSPTCLLFPRGYQMVNAERMRLV